MSPSAISLDASGVTAASASTGVDFTNLYSQAKVESGLDPDARAPTSSARGLYQFTSATWLDTVRRHGGGHGLGWAAEAVAGGSTTRDPAVHAAILDLRRDPPAAALMAGAFAGDDAAKLEAGLGRRQRRAGRRQRLAGRASGGAGRRRGGALRLSAPRRARRLMAAFARPGGRHDPRAALLPVAILALVMLMVVPVAPVLRDIFFVANIIVALAVLMVAINVQRPLDLLQGHLPDCNTVSFYEIPDGKTVELTAVVGPPHATGA